MPTEAFHGVGSVIKLGDGASSEQFAAIAEVNNITGPEITIGTIDATSLDSTGGSREFIAGFIDNGEVTFNFNFKLGTYDDLLAVAYARSLRNWQIVLSDTNQTTFDFAALLTRLGLAVPFEDKVTAPVTLKISGEISLTS